MLGPTRPQCIDRLSDASIVAFMPATSAGEPTNMVLDMIATCANHNERR
jgi:hypothetical protein